MAKVELRRLCAGNDLAERRYEVDGRPVALQDLDVPIFAVGALDNFIAPWRSVHQIHYPTKAEVTFVLSSGDHHSGIIADPGDRHRTFRLATRSRGQACVDAQTWQAKASSHEGSWWPEWQARLVRHSGRPGNPPVIGNPVAGYDPLCDASGTYVFQD